MYAPIGRFVLVKLVEEDRGGLTLKSDIEDSQQRGEVIATGLRYYLDGIEHEHDVVVGDKIVWQKFSESGQVFEEAGEKRAYVSATQILGVEK